MPSAKVAVVKCSEYTRVVNAIKNALDLLGGINTFVKKGSKVLIKPNLCDPLPPEKAATTHPLFVKAIIEMVQNCGATAIVGECPGGNDVKTARKVFDVSGIKRVVEETGASLKNFQEEPFVVRKIENYKVLEKTDFAKAVLEADLIINVPKLKTHGITFMTGAVKNCFGCIHPNERKYIHGNFSERDKFAKGLVDIYSAVLPSLTIMDAVVAMEGDEGPTYGDPKEVGLVLAGTDGVAVDAVASEIIGYRSLAMPTGMEAAKRGIGTTDMKRIEVVGEPVTAVHVTDFKKSSLFEQYNPYKKSNNLQEDFNLIPVLVEEKCTKCGNCANNCPVGAITLDPYPHIDEEKCILCYCCHELCPQGAYRLEKRPNENDGTDLIRLGLKCNQNCVFCTIALDSGSDLTTSEVKNRIDFLAKNGSRKIAFTGGEPTMRKDILELIEYSKKNGMQEIEIQTNGILLSDKTYVRKLKKLGVSLVLVALHSHKKDISERLTRTPNSHAKTIEAIKNMHEQNVGVMISHVICSENYRHLLDFVKFTQKAFSKEIFIYFGLVRPNGNASLNRWVVPTLTEIEPYLHETFSYCMANNIPFNVEGVPLCYMAEFKKKNAELQRMKKKPVFHWALKELREDTHNMHRFENKMKSDRCAFCGMYSECPGVWKEYGELHGTEELYPIW